MATVVGVDAVASSSPSRSTSAALVKVEPKSTQSSARRHASAEPVEGLPEVVDEVLDVLDADREADEVGRHLELGAARRTRASSGPGAR